MANTNDDLDLQVLLKIAGEVDPSIRASIEQTIAQLTALGRSIQYVNQSISEGGSKAFPDILRQARETTAQIKTLMAALPKGQMYRDVPGMPVPSNSSPTTKVAGGVPAIAQYMAFQQRAIKQADAALLAKNLKEGPAVAAAAQQAAMRAQYINEARGGFSKRTISYADVEGMPVPSGSTPHTFVSKQKAAEFLADQRIAASQHLSIAGNPPAGSQYGPFADILVKSFRTYASKPGAGPTAPVLPNFAPMPSAYKTAPLSGDALSAAARNFPSLSEATISRVTNMSVDMAGKLLQRSMAKQGGMLAAGKSITEIGFQNDVASLLKWQASRGGGNGLSLPGNPTAGAYGPFQPGKQPAAWNNPYSSYSSYTAAQAAAKAKPIAQAQTTQFGTKLAATAEQLSNTKAATAIDAWAKKWLELGHSTDEVDKKLAAFVQHDYPKVWALYSGQVNTAAQSQSRFNNVLSALGGIAGTPQQAMNNLLGSLTRIGEFVAGNLIARGIENIISGFMRLGAAASQVVSTIVSDGIETNASLQLIGNELQVILGSAEQAATAMAFVRQKAVETPFFNTEKMAGAIRIMSSFGLNYQKWFDIVAGTAVAFGKDIDQVARAIGQLSTGATGRAILSLRLLGVNVDEAGIKFDKAHHAIGTSQELLAKVETYLRSRFGPVLKSISENWTATIESFRDMWGLLEADVTKPIFDVLLKQARPLADFFNVEANRQKSEALAEVLGEYPARGIQRLLDFVHDAAGSLNLDAADFFKSGVQIIVSFAEGLLSGFEQYVLPAVEAIAQGIANFLVGQSPPPEGPLSYAVEGAMAVMAAYIDGLKAGIDYGTLNEIGGLIEGALNRAVAFGQTTDVQAITDQLDLRSIIAQALVQLKALGEISGVIVGAIQNNFGALAGDVLKYLGLVQQVTAAENEQAVAEKKVADATKLVDAARERLRMFELLSADIPERYTRGRHQELELQITAFERQAKERQLESQAAADRQKELNKQLQGLKDYFAELQKIWQLEAARKKAADAEDPGDVFGKVLPKIDLEVGKRLEAFKQYWRDWLAANVDPQLKKLEGYFTRIGELVRGFLGMGATDPALEDLYKRGELLRKNVQIIVDNIPLIVKTMGDIAAIAINLAPLALGIGGVFLGIVKGIGDAYNALPKPIQDALKTGGAVLVLNWAMGGIIGSVAGLLAQLVLWGGGLLATVGVGAAAAGAFALIATVGLAFVIDENFLGDHLGMIFRKDPDTGKWAFQVVLDFLWKIDPATGKTFGDQLAKEIVNNVGDVPILGGFMRIGEMVTQALVDYLSGATAAGKLSAAANSLFGNITNSAQKTRDDVVTHSIIPDMVDDIISVLYEMANRSVAPVEQLYNNLVAGVGPFEQAWGEAFGYFGRWIDYLVASLLNFNAVLAETAALAATMPAVAVTTEGGGNKGFARGINYVPRDMLTMLHQGERVQNRAAAFAARSGASGMGAPNVSVVNNIEVNVPITRADRSWLERVVEDGTNRGIAKVFNAATTPGRSD